MLHWMTGLAFAQPAPTAPAEDTEDFSDVVYVWPDKFARWRNTRWHTVADLVFPPGLVLAAENNLQFRTVNLQVAAVLACDEEAELGRKRLEVRCTFEDIAIRATALRGHKSERRRAQVQRVLDEIDTTLTGSAIQLQTNERGAVTNIDLEGIDTRNLRQRERAETLRQVVARVVLPFHMKLDKGGMRKGHWVEFDSALMRMPATDASMGHTIVAHHLNPYRGHLLVQDIGEGTMSIPRPPRVSDGPSEGRDPGLGDPEDSLGSGNLTFQLPTPAFEVELAYKLRMDGVSIYDPSNGIMTERVWAVVGEPSAGNPGNLRLWYAGRIRMLGEDEHPDLGRSEQIGYPGISIAGFPEWRPADPELFTGG